MRRKTRILLLGVCTLIVIAMLVIHKQIPQDLSYHIFADRNTVVGIPNFANVFSNIPMLAVVVVCQHESHSQK